MLLAAGEEFGYEKFRNYKLKNKLELGTLTYPACPLGTKTDQVDEYGQAWIYTDNKKLPLVAEIFTKFFNGSSIRPLSLGQVC